MQEMHTLYNVCVIMLLTLMVLIFINPRAGSYCPRSNAAYVVLKCFFLNNNNNNTCLLADEYKTGAWQEQKIAGVLHSA